MMTISEARVIKIPNEYSVVVNAGAESGLKTGDQLEIYAKGEKVIDPYSKKELGTLDFVKARIEVTTLYENMCICKNVERESINPLMSSIDTLKILKSSHKELPVDGKSISGDFSTFEKAIHIGDYVRSAL